MEDEMKQLYEALIKMNERVSQIGNKSDQLETLINALSQYIMQNKGEEITEEETTVIDPFNLGGYKNVSSPNGSVFKVKSKAFCVNGRHTLEEGKPLLICSKCNGIICYQHDKGVYPVMCVDCIQKEIPEIGLLEASILNAVKYKIKISDLKVAINISYKEIVKAQSKLIRDGYIDNDMFFRKFLTVKGLSALNLANKLYEILPENGS